MGIFTNIHVTRTLIQIKQLPVGHIIYCRVWIKSTALSTKNQSLNHTTYMGRNSILKTSHKSIQRFLHSNEVLLHNNHISPSTHVNHTRRPNPTINNRRTHNSIPTEQCNDNALNNALLSLTTVSIY